MKPRPVTATRRPLLAVIADKRTDQVSNIPLRGG
jgi:hypothetical protein